MLAGLFFSCNNDSGSRESLLSAEGDKPETQKEKDEAAKAGVEFLQKAFDNNQLIIAYFKLAEEEAQSLALKNFAGQFAIYYKRLGKQIAYMSRVKKIPLQKNEIPQSEKKKLESLRENTGKEFDRLYLKDLKELLMEQVNLLEAVTKSGLGKTLKNKAAKTMAGLKTHIIAIEELEKDI